MRINNIIYTEEWTQRQENKTKPYAWRATEQNTEHTTHNIDHKRTKIEGLKGLQQKRTDMKHKRNVPMRGTHKTHYSILSTTDRSKTQIKHDKTKQEIYRTGTRHKNKKTWNIKKPKAHNHKPVGPTADRTSGTQEQAMPRQPIYVRKVRHWKPEAIPLPNKCLSRNRLTRMLHQIRKPGQKKYGH